ncbi:conserved hypothetical protein [Frankia canadensis]|uniref:DUF4190 domain-containing protein n=1 Tax=Frankia canadensis TaxID=1836972 RepID=A0A2I2L0S1_9ACTN|nr:hypothetical protein [Frankia canadensis]SNQ51522.1 conserved hypothetical protein [Frankia canadensis]SOU58812.1 conserved hypothetical protein [Frankia canadensis]
MTRPTHSVDDAGTQRIPVPQPADQPYGQPYREPNPPADTPRYGADPNPATSHGGFVPYPDNGMAEMQYGRPPRPAGPGVEPSGVRTLWILAFVFSAVALLVPFVGFAAIACGAVAWGKGSRRGRLATFVAIAATIAGWVIGALVYLS